MYQQSTGTRARFLRDRAPCTSRPLASRRGRQAFRTALRRHAARFIPVLKGRGGNIAVLFAVMAPVLLMSLGAGVDFALAVQARTSLQNIVDSAAISGASAFTSSTGGTAAATVASNYMNLNVTNLPNNQGTTYNVSTAVSTSAYSVTVTANTSIQTTFMYMFVQSIPISATATAAFEGSVGNVNAANWASNAGDHNTIYWYLVPTDGSVPVFKTSNFPNGTFSDGTFTALFTNATTNVPPTSNSTFSVPPGRSVGFALVNVTGGLANYGNNQYGGTPGTTHVFYSQLTIPNDSSNNPGGYTNKADYTNGLTCTGKNPPSGCGKIENCSLQTIQVTGSSLPTPKAGGCFTAAQTNASPTCAALAGQTWSYYWNDMGGTTDDFDYNDASFTFTCSGGLSGGNGLVNGVLLTN